MLLLRRGQGRSAGWTVAVAGVAVLSLLTGPTAQADEPVPTPSEPAPVEPAPVEPAPVEPPPPAVPTPPPLVMPAEIGSWCSTLFPPGKPKRERKLAQGLMAGKVDMGKGGTYYLSEHPNWQPQRGTDTSGDRHVNSLNWALPLLYRGVHVQNQPMVERFRQLLYYWINDHQGARGVWVDGSIYGGLRTQTLVCAGQTLNDPTIIAAALRDSQTMIRSYRSHSEVAYGTNNTELIRQTGALAAYCWVNDEAGRTRAWSNVQAIARGLVNPDGSDVEGSPGYAQYIENLLLDVERSAGTCGLPADPITGLRGLLYQFVAQTMRPDFKMESLGDTVAEPMRGTFGIGDWRADWIRSSGTAGTPPTPVYRSFDGGYVFGRAGWNPQPGGPDTYYSLRFSSSRPNTAHTHDDGGGLTFYSRGVEWIGDPGPYRYENGSSLRWFMKSRTAHSSFTVSNVRRTSTNGVRKITSTSDWTVGGNDYTCVDDRTWSTVDVTRCTTYVRSIDAFLVADYVSAKRLPGKKKQLKRAPVRTMTQRWQITPGVGAEKYENDILTLAAGDKRLDIYKAGPGNWDIRTARNGSSVGWFTGTWGQKVPGAVLSRQVGLRPRADAQVLVTVLVPRTDAESVPVTIDANGVTVTRNGVAITTPLPAPR
ncbi:MAG: hypothetical protein GC156_11425 [Actinomycetales bacterium]|nr:hypothetical protein [Actinomycetales bacterium]